VEAGTVLNRAIITRENFSLLIDFMMHDEPVPARVMEDLNDAKEAAKHISYAITPYGLREGLSSLKYEPDFPL